jgi:hypothetical protein
MSYSVISVGPKAEVRAIVAKQLTVEASNYHGQNEEEARDIEAIRTRALLLIDEMATTEEKQGVSVELHGHHAKLDNGITHAELHLSVSTTKL